MHLVDSGEDPVGFGARAEEDGLEHLCGRDETVERTVRGAVVQQGAHEVPRVDGADAERALAVEKSHRALPLDAAEHGAGREVAVVASHWPISQDHKPARRTRVPLELPDAR